MSPGSVIAGKYTLIEVIGQGGMARVWRARRLSDRRLVALKLLGLGAPQEASWRRRFEREAKLLTSLGLRSPHLVQVEDYALDAASGPFLVMELLSGETLATRLAGGARLPARDAVRIVNELCAALGVAHQAGVIHRDVKPANVFLHRPAGTEIVKLLDFGVAKAPAETDLTALTRDGALLGTPQYMSPEQFMGDSEIDARADLWSVGVVAYQMLVGHAPFSRGSPAELAARVLGRQPAPASSLVASLPKAVDAWFEHALAKRPADRFADALELGTAFSAALEAVHSERPPALAFRVKGGALRATLNALCDLYDEQFCERVLERCSPETARALRANVLVSSFYPGSLFVDVSRAAVSLAGPEILRKLGALSAEEALGSGGFFELFIKLSRGRGAARFLQSSSDIFRLYYDRGAWEVDALGEGWARCRFVEGGRFPPEVVERLLGYLERGLALVGAEHVTLSTYAHDDDVIVRIEWSEGSG